LTRLRQEQPPVRQPILRGLRPDHRGAHGVRPARGPHPDEHQRLSHRPGQRRGPVRHRTQHRGDQSDRRVRGEQRRRLESVELEGDRVPTLVERLRPGAAHDDAPVTIDGKGRLTRERRREQRNTDCNREAHERRTTDQGRRDFSHSNAILCTMRKVSRYQATAATAPTVRAVAWDPAGTDRSVSITYPATRSVVTMATRRPTRDALLVTSLVHV